MRRLLRALAKKLRPMTSEETEDPTGDLTSFQQDAEQNALRKEQKQECLILQLPSDVILEIADALELHERAILSETCLVLRHLIFSRMKKSWGKRTIDQQIKYLTLASRQVLDKWVCLRCAKLHPVKRGRARDHCRYVCPKMTEKPYFIRSYHEEKAFHYHGIRQEGVLQALKYARTPNLEDQYQRDLEYMLAPKCASYVVDYNGEPPRSVRMLMFPKIINGSYFIKIEYHHDTHLSVREKFSLRIGNCDGDKGPWVNTVHTPDICHRCCISRAGKKARDYEGKMLNGFCQFCPFEFSVNVSRGLHNMLVTMWVCLGYEQCTIPIFPEYHDCATRVARPFRCARHVSWGIRAMYESV